MDASCEPQKAYPEARRRAVPDSSAASAALERLRGQEAVVASCPILCAVLGKHGAEQGRDRSLFRCFALGRRITALSCSSRREAGARDTGRMHAG